MYPISSRARIPDNLIGRRISHFKIISKLGVGGMGEVWRAEDTQLGREVAIKMLPEEFSADEERLARFEREAHVLASLNHPNIAGIHQVEVVEDRRFLVMEFAEGEDLSERLSRGPIPPDQAIHIALQIAEGLEAAHGRGIVHRDLKPANVIVAPDGQVKILDFGLAKESQRASQTSPDLTATPTLTAQMPQAGAILGTAGYMSPEQARGGEADQRSDIWSFGVMLWEMLTGQHLFVEPTVSETLAAVLRADLDLGILPHETPWRVRDVLARCLVRDPNNRLHSIADARIAMTVEEEPPEVAESLRRAQPWGLIGLIVAVALVAGLLVGRSLWPRAEIERMPARLSIEIESITSESNRIALSQDGRSLVYSGGDPPRLYHRPLDQLDSIPIAGTEGSQSPFFSPDGEWVAFLAGTSLKKVPLQGGRPVVLYQFPGKVASLRGGAWSTEGRIFVSFLSTGSYGYATLLELPEQGGEPREVLPTLGADGKHSEHVQPQLLPGQGRLLFNRLRGDRFYAAANSDVQVVDLVTREVTTVLEKHGLSRYPPSGHLISVSGPGTVTVAPFDAETLEIVGPTVPIRDLIQTGPDGIDGHLATADNGTVIFQRALPESQLKELVWLDLDGGTSTVPIESRQFAAAVLAPNGERAVVSIGGRMAGQRLWLYDFERQVLSILTTDVETFAPVWSRDSNDLIFQAIGDSASLGIQRLPAVGGSADLLAETGTVWTSPWDISPDGETLALFLWNPETETDWDILLTSTRGGGSPTTFAHESTDEYHPRFSPDGEWLAFVSNRTGNYEIFLKRFPEEGPLIQVTHQGGRYPMWAPDGSRLLYLTEDHSVLMAIDVTWGEQPEFGSAYKIVEIPPALRPSNSWAAWASLSLDGQRLLTVLSRPRVIERLTVILDWSQELKRLAPPAEF